MKRNIRNNSRDDNEDDKFNFDIPEYEIDPLKPLRITKLRVKSDGVLGVNAVSAAKNREEIARMILQIEEHWINDTSMGSDPPLLVDPLADNLYENYHKKMVKQETRMMNDEANHSESEAERLERILEGLDVASWRVFLPKVAVINDLTDESELNRKRELTQKTILSMLTKYKNMKRRISMHARKQRHLVIDPHKQIGKLYSKLDKSLVAGYHSSSDDDDLTCDLAQLKKRRKIRKCKNFGPSLIIPLCLPTSPSEFQFGIIAEPLKSPYLIKLTKEERAKYLEKVPNKGKRYRNVRSFQNQAVKIIDRAPTTCDLQPTNDD